MFNLMLKFRGNICIQVDVGVYRWEYPERFLFEEDETLFMQSLKSILSVQDVQYPVDTDDLELKENVEQCFWF